MKKNIKVTDIDTGELLHDITFDGGFDLIYARLDDGGNMKHIRNLDNAKFDDKHWIKNYAYRPVAEKIVKNFDYLKHIIPGDILFLEDTEWIKKASMKRKQKWVARVMKAGKQFEAITGYQYILETRRYYTEEMTNEQIVALIYHELRHIDEDGNLEAHDVEDWGNMVATLGPDWATTKAMIPDILADGFDFKELKRSQLSMFDDGKVISMRAAK